MPSSDQSSRRCSSPVCHASQVPCSSRFLQTGGIACRASRPLKRLGSWMTIFQASNLRFARRDRIARGPSPFEHARLSAELVLRYAKDAFNTARVPNDNLNVSLFSKARAGIRGLAFREDALEGVNRGASAFRESCVAAERQRSRGFAGVRPCCLRADPMQRPESLQPSFYRQSSPNPSRWRL